MRKQDNTSVEGRILALEEGIQQILGIVGAASGRVDTVQGRNEDSKRGSESDDVNKDVQMTGTKDIFGSERRHATYRDRSNFYSELMQKNAVEHQAELNALKIMAIKAMDCRHADKYCQLSPSKEE